jgi:hypothetical protein
LLLASNSLAVLLTPSRLSRLIRRSFCLAVLRVVLTCSSSAELNPRMFSKVLASLCKSSSLVLVNTCRTTWYATFFLSSRVYRSFFTVFRLPVSRGQLLRTSWVPSTNLARTSPYVQCSSCSFAKSDLVI